MFVDRQQLTKSFVILLSLSLLPCLLLACATNSTLHKTYNYARFSCPIEAHFASGSQFSTLEKQDTSALTIKWQPHPGPDTSATTPSQVTLQVELIGPLPSLDSFQQNLQSDGSMKYFPTTPVVAAAPAIQTNDWTNQTYASNIQLPQKLVSGYYQVLEMIDIGSNNGGIHDPGRCIVKV